MSFLKQKRLLKEHELKQYNDLRKMYFLKSKELEQILDALKDYEIHFHNKTISDRIKLKNNNFKNKN